MKTQFQNPIAISVATFGLLLAAGCGSNNNPTTSSQPQGANATPTPGGYQYSISETFVDGSTCTYQSPDYGTLREYCSALEDAKLNNNCALQEREELFQANCNGNFNPGSGGNPQPEPPQPPEPQPPRPQPPRPQPPVPTPPAPPPPQPQPNDSCTIRDLSQGFGHLPEFEVIAQNGAVLATFPTDQQAIQFQNTDPRCRQGR